MNIFIMFCKFGLLDVYNGLIFFLCYLISSCFSYGIYIVV